MCRKIRDIAQIFNNIIFFWPSLLLQYRKQINKHETFSFQTKSTVIRLTGKLMYQTLHKDLEYNSVKFSNE